MKTYFLFAFLACSHLIFAQKNKNLIGFEFAYGGSTFAMKNLNRFYIDSFAAKPQIDLLQNRIEIGHQFRLATYFKPLPMFDVGVYGSYQFASSKANPIITETDPMGFPMKMHRGKFELRTEAIGVGIASTFYFSHFLKFQEKESTLNRLHLGIEVNGGVGFSKAIFDLRYYTFPEASDFDYFNSRDFQGQAGIKVEYDFTKSPFFTTLGIRFGYQYFKTKTIKNRNGDEWVLLGKYPINLDFSGFYFGTYLKFGR